MSRIFASNVTLAHMQPTLLWPDKYDSKKPDYTILDKTTNEYYLNDDRLLIRQKNFLLIIGTPIIHSIVAILQILISSFKLCMHLTNVILGGYSNMAKNFHMALEELGKIILAPLLIAALEITAIAGLIFPLNARKIFASIERIITNNLQIENDNAECSCRYNKAILAACFQPIQIQAN